MITVLIQKVANCGFALLLVWLSEECESSTMRHSYWLFLLWLYPINPKKEFVCCQLNCISLYVLSVCWNYEHEKSSSSSVMWKLRIRKRLLMSVSSALPAGTFEKIMLTCLDIFIMPYTVISISCTTAVVCHKFCLLSTWLFDIRIGLGTGEFCSCTGNKIFWYFQHLTVYKYAWQAKQQCGHWTVI